MQTHSSFARGRYFYFCYVLCCECFQDFSIDIKQAGIQLASLSIAQASVKGVLDKWMCSVGIIVR